MLVLTRKRNESIHIGDDIVIKIVRTGNGAVKIGVEAPQSVRVIRGELEGKPLPDSARKRASEHLLSKKRTDSAPARVA